jgi:prevent-host-death family protein
MRLRQHCSLPWAWTAGCDPAEPKFCRRDVPEARAKLLLQHGEAWISAVDGGRRLDRRGPGSQIDEGVELQYTHYQDIAIQGEWQAMATATYVSIGQVKRDISELVNRVAYGQEQVVLTSRGKPKAVLISIEDFERLQQKPTQATKWADWVARSDALAADILASRNGEPLDIDALLAADRADLEARDDQILGR